MKTKLIVKIMSVAVLALPLAALLAPPGFVDSAQAQVQMKEGYYKNIVGTDFVKQYVDIPPRKDVALIDARPAARQYDNGHLPGAINIPDSQFDKMTNRLPADKNMLVIVYCGGLECMLSHNVAHKMEKLGYTNIKVYAEGNPAWSKAGLPLSVSTVFVKKLLDDKEKFMLIDSRPKRVFGQGAIPGAVNIPDSEFEKNVSQLPADKATFLVFYCGGLECVLSDKSAEKAQKLGYTNVKTYAEGYPAWIKAYPSSKAVAATDAPAAPAAAKQAVDIVPGKEKGSITNASFEKLVKETPNAVLFVDVRDAKEFERGHLKGAINIPIGELDKKLAALPTDKPVIFLCSTGGRSGEAYDTVKLLRAEVQAYFVDAEITFAADGSYQLKGKS